MKYNKAISDYTKALELGYPDNELYADRGRAYSNSDQYKEAILDQTHYIELHPDDAGAYDSRAFTYEKSGLFNDAINDYTKVIEMRPKSERTYFERSNVYFEGLNDIENGCADLKEACRLNMCEDFSTRGHHGEKCTSPSVDKELLKAGKNPKEVLVGSGIEFTADEFVKAAKEGRINVVRLFIDAGMDINTQDKLQLRALTTAAFHGHYDIVKYLVEKGADLSVINYGGNNALIEAARSNNTAMAILLIELGVEINALDNQGHTVLYSAETAEMATLLLDNGADIYITSDYQGPLNALVHDNNVAVARVFIENGAPINAKDKFGSTSLNEAARRKKIEMARLLIEHGAELDTKNDWGVSGLEYALNNKGPGYD